MSRCHRALATLGIALAAGGCAGRAKVSTLPQGAEVTGLYRAESRAENERPRRFRVWIWAREPGRFHAEVVSPVGSTAMIFDAGEAGLAVALPRENTVFVGPADATALTRLVGLAVPVEGLVSALLSGLSPSREIRVRREGDAAPALPTSLELSTPTRRLSLELVRLELVAAPATGLGSGRPPEGLEIRPLSELPLEIASDGRRQP